MKRLFVLSLCLALLAGCSQQNQTEPTPTETPKTNLPCNVDEPCGEDETTPVLENQADMSEYTTLEDENHVFVAIEYSDLLTMIEEKQTAVIYIGRPTCPWCVEAVPVLNEVAKEYNQIVYYANTRSDYNQSDAGKADRDELVVFMHDVLDENDEGEKALFIPDVLFLKEGEILANHIGTVGDYDAHERVMNEEELAEFTSIYQNYFEQLLAE